MMIGRLHGPRLHCKVNLSPVGSVIVALTRGASLRGPVEAGQSASLAAAQQDDQPQRAAHNGAHGEPAYSGSNYC